MEIGGRVDRVTRLVVPEEVGRQLNAFSRGLSLLIKSLRITESKRGLGEGGEEGQ